MRDFSPAMEKNKIRFPNGICGKNTPFAGKAQGESEEEMRECGNAHVGE
jgi:hypothetical protein